MKWILSKKHEPRHSCNTLRQRDAIQTTIFCRQTSYMDRIAEHLGHYASSPCFNDVSTLWQLTTKSSTCRNLKHKTDCFAEPSCTWYPPHHRCPVSLFKTASLLGCGKRRGVIWIPGTSCTTSRAKAMYRRNWAM